MKKLNSLLLMFTLLVSLVTFSEEVPVVEDPVKVIQSTIVKLNKLTTATVYSSQMMEFLVDQEISPLFDFEYIAREVLSASYLTLGEEESVFFANKLKRNIVSTLLSKLAQSRMGSLNFVSARPTMYRNIIVKLKAKGYGYSQFGLNLDLSFHKNKSGKWQIFDVALDHDSLVNYYQRMVRSKVRRYGVYGMLGRI